MSILSGPIQALGELQTRRVSGTVAAIRGLSVLVDDLPLPVGALVMLCDQSRGQAGQQPLTHGEVVGFDGARSVVMLLGEATGVRPGTSVRGERSARSAAVGQCMLGRVIDGLGRPIDGGEPLRDLHLRPLEPPPATAMHRGRISEPLSTGLRSIDAMLTLGKGQRIGVFSGAGVGKSTLMASVARHASSQVNVIGLIGERGREVREFIDATLGTDGLARSVLVVATGDESPLLRVRAAQLTCCIAEFFRDCGADVMLMMDSITRFAQAQRQIGLTVGEQPATKGFTPSVFAMLPRLLERAGVMDQGGSITGLYTVLVEGDDLDEPISDAARGILDGHIVLSRKLATRGHFPAVDVLGSVSRVADAVCDTHHIEARRMLVRLMAAYAEAEELINIGAYAAGSNPMCDVAIRLKPEIDRFLQQGAGIGTPYPQTCRNLIELAGLAGQELAQKTTAAGGAG